MKVKELRQKSVEELKVLLSDSREKMRELRFKVYQKQLKNVRQVRDVKKEIAKLQTLLKEKK